MPSESVLIEKKKIVEELTGKLKSQAGVFVDYCGITVNEDTEMRVKMREANVDYSVIKNTLMRFAVKNVGLEALEPILVGTTSLAVSYEDPIDPARIIKEYADKLPNYFAIKGGFMDGKALTVEEVNKIATIPPLPILQAQLLGTLLAPITCLAVVLKAIAEKSGAPVDVEVSVGPEGGAPAEEAAPVESAPVEVAPVEAAKEAPVEAAPVEAAPVEATPVVEAAKEAPAEEAVPVEAAKEAPAEEAAPVEAAKEAPAEAPVEAAKEAPAEEAAPVEAPAEAPVKEAAAPAKATKKAPAKATTEEAAPAKAARKAPAKAAAEETAPADESAPKKAPAKPRAKKTDPPEAAE